AYGYLFNSYYEAVGARHPRPERGLLSRPGIAEIARYRAHVDAGMTELFASLDEACWTAVAGLAELGLHHEQQHQELLLMDIKHVLSVNPLQPAYRRAAPPPRRAPPPLTWHAFAGGLRQIGHAAPASPSTTRRRVTKSGSSRSASPRASSPAATMPNSSPPADIGGRSSGSRRAGLWCSSKDGRHRFTGSKRKTAGRSSRSPEVGRSAR